MCNEGLTEDLLCTSRHDRLFEYLPDGTETSKPNCLQLDPKKVPGREGSEQDFTWRFMNSNCTYNSIITTLGHSYKGLISGL